MFKFIKQYAENIDNAQVYPMFSLLVFFIFFVVLLFLVKKMDRNQVEKLSNIPFDKQETHSWNN
jgi:quinol-cytochrome oxidoreductase complex cytochrome b subunit